MKSLPMTSKLNTGRIIRGIAGFYYVDNGEQVFECKARGSFKNENIKLLVGDIVDFDIINEEEKVGNIVHLHLRKNKISRPALTNVDQIVLVSSLSKPLFDLFNLDKQILINENLGIKTILVFNKLDEVDDGCVDYIKSVYRHSKIECYFVSAFTNEGIDQLLKVINGKLTVFSGSSGVGKSCLLNSILGCNKMSVGSISEKIGRGRHTTRHSEIFALDETTYLADTPGYSNIEIKNIEKEELRYLFGEFLEFNDKCKFNTCTHIHEPKCRLKQAIEEGIVSKERYLSYLKIFEEINSKKNYD